jgi:hypothetical protein
MDPIKRLGSFWFVLIPDLLFFILICRDRRTTCSVYSTHPTRTIEPILPNKIVDSVSAILPPTILTCTPERKKYHARYSLQT